MQHVLGTHPSCSRNMACHGQFQRYRRPSCGAVRSRATRARTAPVVRCAIDMQHFSAQLVDQTLNPRVASLKPSKTMVLTDLGRSMRESGIDIIGLSAGEPDFDTPEAIVEAGVNAIRSGKTRYSPNTGTSQLRQAISAKLRGVTNGAMAVVPLLAAENKLDYGADQIVVSNGAKQSIWQAVLATCSPGDEVIIPAPYWVSYPEMAKLAGASPVIVDTEPDFFLLTAEKLRSVLTPKSRLLIICSPSNPSGRCIPPEQMKALAQVVAEHPRLLVLADEIYEYITYRPAFHVSFGSIPGMLDRTLTVNGFSKAYAMTGWRLGYLAAPPRFAKAAASVQSQSTSGASSISQEAGLAALQLGPRGGKPVAKMLEAFRERRDAVLKRLRGIPGVSVVEPEGAFYVLPDFSHFFGEGVYADGFGPVPDSDALCQYLLEFAHVAMVPGEAFGAPKCLRLSYASSLQDIHRALDRVAEALEPQRLHKPLSKYIDQSAALPSPTTPDEGQISRNSPPL